jgi:hypothetical protein
MAITHEEIFSFLQNKTIKSVSTDPDDSYSNLVILLSDGSMLYIYSDNPFYIGIAPNIIN